MSSRRDQQSTTLSEWAQPLVSWQSGVDSSAHHRHLLAHGELLATWPPAPFESTPTDCFKLGDDYWIWQPGVGGIRFRGDQPECLAFPSETVSQDWFEHLVSR
ncbi:MAG: hypothetical protein ACT4QD_14500, partial [Acidobacteriota bacterium]